ncbi:MAG: hypothetical protein PUJ09_06420, partial [Eubacteriales bacterium]|nr:hypothetical protein [Eubacteriales bacterium]
LGSMTYAPFSTTVICEHLSRIAETHTAMYAAAAGNVSAAAVMRNALAPGHETFFVIIISILPLCGSTNSDQ